MANKQVLVVNGRRFEDTLATTRFMGAHNLCVCESLCSDCEFYAGGGVGHADEGGVALYKLDLPRKQWRFVQQLIGTSQEGGIEWRGACWPLGNAPLCLDGLSCLTKFKGEWFLYFRANIGADGRRYVQVCKGSTLDSLGPFQLIHIQNYDVSNDVYLFHVYDLGEMALALAPVSIADGGGIYTTTSFDGIVFSPLRVLLPCDSFQHRTAHMPAYGLEVVG